MAKLAENHAVTRPAPEVRKTNRCTLDVRDIPLECFRHPRDGRRWQQPARCRYTLLLRLSTHANPDGTFMSEDGRKNYSPRAERLELHFASRSMYRHMDDLKDLGFLDWEREKKHYGRRIYQITMPEKTPATKLKNTCHETEDHLPQLRTTAVLPSTVKGKDLPRPVCGNVEKAASPLVPHSSLKKKKREKTPQQQRWAAVAALAREVESILRRDRRIAEGDLVEDLKKFAAVNDIPYFDGWPGAASPIEQAITIGSQRIREEEEATASQRRERGIPPARAIEPNRTKHFTRSA